MAEPNMQDRSTRRKARKTGKRKSLLRMILFSIAAALILVGGVAAALVWQVDKTLDQVTEPTKDGVNTLDPGVDLTYHSDKSISMVILGRDTRPETGSLNTDVMIVAVANPQTKKVTMVSLPRDTRVKIPGYRGYHKINSVYANGEAERRQAERNGEQPTVNGVTLTKKTLQELVGIPIEHYVEIDFQGFRSVIDELGGVEVNVDRRLVYNDPTDGTHIDLSPGLQILDGDQALDYVRHREDSRGPKYYSSDYDRNRRQQEVIKAIVDKMTSLEALPKVFKLIEVAGEHVQTDLSKDKIEGLVMDFKGINSTSIQTLDNGAYWQGSYTYWPKENLYQVRETLQAEMGLTGSMVADLDDSPIYTADSVAPAKASSASSSKPKVTKKVTETAAEAPATKPTENEQTEEVQVPPDMAPLDGQGETGHNQPADSIDEQNGSDIPVNSDPPANPAGDANGTEPTEPDQQTEPVETPPAEPVPQLPDQQTVPQSVPAQEQTPANGVQAEG
ncbi:LCP family protein [Brevibacillus fulvus]|uniref:LCP family protein required for cell wall assembly n=1 Tax=Brevibacillus fulvus TaxID=1125967 RepID=A0A938Y0K5_9BACL|nr:LCP family protein [Brevibacillus fulvus]MBM7590983.1 LCP family protein required for cell wall assembly [Brevibacillus fulvus]